MAKILMVGLFAIFLLKQSLFSQTEYMPIGAKLSGIAYFAFPFSDGSFTSTSEKDTLCDGIPCRKIVKVETSSLPPKTYALTYYSRQVGDSIFYWNSSARGFDLAFRTKMSVNDSIKYKFFNNSLGDTSVTLYADSVKFINSMQITKCHLLCPSYISGGVPTRVEFTIYDRFGTAFDNAPSFFCNLGFYDGARYVPICYKDNQIFFTTPNYNGSNCALTTKTYENNNLYISVSPNPTYNYLNIECNNNSLIEKCSLIDPLGHIQQEEAFNNVKSIHWIINNASNGIYFLKIETSLGYSILKKVVVQQ